MNIKGLIITVIETIIKVVILAVAVMYILKGVNLAYDFGYKVFADEPMSANNPRTITVGVGESAGVKDIAAMLEDKGLIGDAKLFMVQEYLSAYHNKIQPGIYDLSTGMTASEMIQVMSGNGEEILKRLQLEPTLVEDSALSEDALEAQSNEEGFDVMQEDMTEEAVEE